MDNIITRIITITLIMIMSKTMIIIIIESNFYTWFVKKDKTVIIHLNCSK